jgi:hypothetical protein
MCKENDSLLHDHGRSEANTIDHGTKGLDDVATHRSINFVFQMTLGILLADVTRAQLLGSHCGFFLKAFVVLFCQPKHLLQSKETKRKKILIE